MSLPSSEELEVIKEFRNQVQDTLSEELLQDDMYLIRWLRARDLDLSKSESMLRNNVKWRKENNVDNILEMKPDLYFFEKFPRWMDGFDREGRPVFTAAFGKWDFRNIAKDGKTPEGFVQYVTEGFEQLMKAIAESNERLKTAENSHPVTQFVAIFDFEGFPYGQLLNYKAISNFLQLGAMYEAYYPEILHTAYFINCPFFISKILSLVRPIIAPKTMNKIKCLGGKDQWSEPILAAISPDQIRPQFGGTLGAISTNESEHEHD